MTDLTDPEKIESDLAFETALRPKNLSEFVGQELVRKQVQLLIDAAKLQGRTADHVLLSGPPGLGKTTLALIIAEESGHSIRLTSGPTIQHAGDLASILTSLVPGEILFIDEIHRMARPAEELLYLAMEDFRVDVMVGKGAGANSISLDLAPFTLIGATTRAGLLPNPLRDRFGFTGHLDFYETAELAEVIRRAAAKLSVAISDSALDLVSSRSRGTPRIANRLLRRVRDYSLVNADGVVTEDLARAALDLYQVDGRGLDRLDRAVLTALVQRFGGKPVGLGTLAAAIGEEADTIESMVEPFLVREGLIQRTPKGRQATRLAFEHLGVGLPPMLDGMLDL